MTDGAPEDANQAGWNETVRAVLRARIAAGEPFLDFPFSRQQADGVRQQSLLTPLPQPELHSARLNHLLGALPDVDFDFMARHLEPFTSRLGQAIYEPGGRLQHAIFPTTSIVSLYYVTASGASAETAAVGKEGMVGLALFMGGDTTAGSARVLVVGGAVGLPAGQLRQTFESVDPLRALLPRHVMTLIAQITLLAVCNRHHPIEQQFCRWLLCALDRLPCVGKASPTPGTKG